MKIEEAILDARQLNTELIRNISKALDKPLTHAEFLERAKRKFPTFVNTALRPNLSLLSVNDQNRVHHQPNAKPRRTDSDHQNDLLFKVRHSAKLVTYERYDQEKHGIWELYLDANGRPTKTQLRVRQVSGDNDSLDTVEAALEEENYFDATGVADARQRVLREIVQRRGQRVFRNTLLKAYEGKCAITGTSCESVLEAAHIVSYRGPKTNIVNNGLLLRADIHTLFDLGLIWIEDEVVAMDSKLLAVEEYQCLAGKTLTLPKRKSDRPSTEALRKHAEGSKPK